VYIYGSYRKIKTGIPIFWTTLYLSIVLPYAGLRFTANKDYHFSFDVSIHVYNSQDKESELAAINDLLSSAAVSSELLRLFCHQHPLIVSQLHLSSDFQQQLACDKPNLDRLF